MRGFLTFLFLLAALAIPASSWEASTSANLAISVTPGQAITAVSLSNNSFTGGAASGTVVGAISVTMSPSSPAFSGSLSLSGTNASSFQIVGSNLETNGTVKAGTYNVNVVATQAGAAGSPFTAAETITGTSRGSSGDPTVGVLPSYNDAYANWTKAGMQAQGGIPNRTTICATLSPTGVTPPASTDDYNNIQTAINNCPAGDVVLLNTGTYNIDVTEGILITKGISLRGAGTCNGTSQHSYCPTQIIRPNGVLPYISGLTPGQCGTSKTSLNSCAVTAIIGVSNAGAYGNVWGGCQYPDDVEAGNCAATRYATLAADGSQGNTTVQVDNTSIFSVGMWVLINENTQATFQTDPVPRQAGGQVFSSPDTFNSSGSPASGRVSYSYFNPYPGYGATSAADAETESANYSLFYDRPYGEIHLISAIGPGPCPGTNCTLTFDSPLMIAMRQSNGHNGKVFIPTANSGPSYPYLPLLQGAGIENLTVGRGNESNIGISYCAYCWVKNVESYGWLGGAVEISASARVELNNVYGYDCYSSVNDGAEYVFDIEGGSTEIGIFNSISRTGGKNMTARGAGGGSVVAYNYFDDLWYDAEFGIGNTWIDELANATHFPGTHMVLFEGNQAVNLDGDDTHGSGANYMTFFRNWSTGYRTPFTDPEGSAVNDFTNGAAPLRAAGPAPYNYWYAFVGNVLGGTLNNVIGATPESTTANGWAYYRAYNGATKAIFMPGSDGSNVDANLDYIHNASPYALHDGNFDYVNNAVEWAGSPHTLPNSLYLTSAPSYFAGGASCSYPWPWVTPTGGSPLLTASGSGPCTSYSGLPAKARWDAGTLLNQP